uniref:Ig-like domain-containing protein n=1 Tax=Oreochromis aureus TaxID=47969 RepID=A0A668RHY7_OREAU
MFFLGFLFVCFFNKISQAVVVEVNEGKMFVLLPCQYSGVIFKNHTVMWTRNDLNPKTVHRQREGGDDLREQNQCYSGRTSIRPGARDTGDFSLTLRKPTESHSGKYTCSITDGQEELTDVQLQVKGQQQTPDENTGVHHASVTTNVFLLLLLCLIMLLLSS